MGDKNKSGYELRTDLLGMAIGILQDRQNRQEGNEHFAAENDSNYKRKAVNPYATEDVLVVAEKLYDFVQDK
jgi:hypothetical protein